MRKARKALLIADLINDFFDKNGALYCGDESRKIVGPIVKEIRRARRSGALIVFLNDTHLPDDREFRLWGPHAIEGSWGAELIPEIKAEMRRGDIVIHKFRYSAVFGTRLDAVLRHHGVRAVELVGACASICVMETARDLLDLGYEVTVLRKGVIDFDAESLDTALRRMERVLGAKVK